MEIADQKSPSLSHVKYRPDIDGLRAIAVLSVVGFHAFPEWVVGGFIGVDVFFVISGFLISTLIFSNCDRGTFTFRAFYARRIKRIFPALLLVLITCYTFGWFALLTNEYKELGRHIAAGAGFVSNFLLWNEAGYFDSAADIKPLLHLWSLGIEEQFYILFPPLVFCFYKHRFSRATLLLLIVSISFSLNLAIIHTHAVAAFYSPVTRFWELMIGSLLAWWMLYRKDSLTPKTALILEKTSMGLRDLASLTGLLLIALAVLIITKEKMFPGWWALLPTLGAAMIIAAGPETRLNRAILSHPLLVWFGLISYPLYLWHWPLLSFARIGVGSTPSETIRLAAVLISILLAWLTYRFLERPIRFDKQHKPYVQLLCLLMGLAACLGWSTQYLLSGKHTYRKIDVLMAAQNNLNDMKNKILAQDMSCKQFLNIDSPNMIFKSNSSKPELMVLGDSTAPSFNYAAFTGKVPLQTLEIGRPGCLPFVNFVNYGATETLEKQKFCNAMNQAAIKQLDTLKSIHTVALVSSGSLYLRGGFGVLKNQQDWSKYKITSADGKYTGTNKQAFIDGYSETIQRLLKTGRRVVFVKEMPELEIKTVDCLLTGPIFTFLAKKPASCKIDKSTLDDWQSDYNAAVAEIAHKNPGLLMYDPSGLVCDAKFCYGMKDDKIYYYDSHHLSLEGSELVLKDFIQWLKAKGIALKTQP